MISTPNSLHQLLTTYTCEHLISDDSPLKSALLDYSYGPKLPITLDSTLSMKDACDVLAKNRISSAPIFDNNSKTFLGQLDYFDLVAHILKVLTTISIDDRANSMTMGDIFKKENSTALPLSGITTYHPLVVIQKSAPLLDLLDEFVRANAHRVAVFDGTTFMGIISQSALAAVIVSKFGLRKESSVQWQTGQKSLEELKIIETEFVSVPPTASVMDVLLRMHLKKISSVAIVSGKQLLGTISMSDVKTIFAELNGWKHLFANCLTFFKDLRNKQTMDHDGNDLMPTFTVHPTSSLISTMEKMTATHTHRIWVVDSHQQVVGVVSLSSIIPILRT
ncbi:hypothetical protein BC833DRAFT_581847 [Globomyces pollinis-pini]|nr:hypothetical protein BC833DRAFT_581847 [Globomyces pollinis-pini]